MLTYACAFSSPQAAPGRAYIGSGYTRISHNHCCSYSCSCACSFRSSSSSRSSSSICSSSSSSSSGSSGSSVTAWAGLAVMSRAVREERGKYILRRASAPLAPEVLETTNRHNENDGVSKRVHEPALGIVICFGSAEFPHIYATLYLDASLHSPTTLPASASPTAFLVSSCAHRLAGVPDHRILPASVGPHPLIISPRPRSLAPSLSRCRPTA